MPNEIVISTNTITELANAYGADRTGIDGPGAGIYYCTGEFGNPPSEGAPEYQDMEISLPAVDGLGIKRMGFRGRPIFCRLAFVGTTKSQCETLKSNFFDTITTLASFTITLPGGTARPSCRIVHGSATTGQWTYANGVFMLLVDMSFRQIRLT